MTFLVLNAPQGCVIASDRLQVGAEEVQALDDALALADRMRALHAGQAQRVEAACSAGWRQGHAEGHVAGHVAARDTAAQVLAETLARLADGAAQQRAALRDAVLTLSLLVVRRLAASWPRDEVLATLAAQVLDQIAAEEARRRGVPTAAAVLVHVHPELAPALRARLAGRANLVVECRADAALAPLDCVIETPAGRLLAGLEAQLQRVEAVLRDAQRSAPAAEPVETA